jgi:UDP-glucose 4-epimerase
VSVYNFIKNKCEDKKIRYVWLRVFSGYGPKSNKKWIIPFVISKLLKRNKIEFTAGEQIYNFIFINDIVSAIVKSLSQLKAYGAYNLGHENSYKIKSVISIIFKKLKIKEKPIFGSLKYRNDQVMSFNPSINKIKKDLNWKPKYSLSKGLDMTIRYFKSKLK